jgi:hypothetical protein
MCYEKNLNFQTCTFAKRRKGGNTNLESQRTPIEHKKGASMSNKQSTTKECYE